MLLAMAAACASNNTTGPDLGPVVDANTSAETRVQGPLPGSQAEFEAVGHRVFFATDTHSLSPQARDVLQGQADWLKRYPNARILVAGNCDERGTREYNLALGARRAEAARAYLVSLGVPGNRISTVSYGKERPIDPRSTDAAWSRNRNATSMIVGDQS